MIPYSFFTVLAALWLYGVTSFETISDARSFTVDTIPHKMPGRDAEILSRPDV